MTFKVWFCLSGASFPTQVCITLPSLFTSSMVGRRPFNSHPVQGSLPDLIKVHTLMIQVRFRVRYWLRQHGYQFHVFSDAFLDVPKKRCALRAKVAMGRKSENERPAISVPADLGNPFTQIGTDRYNVNRTRWRRPPRSGVRKKVGLYQYERKQNGGSGCCSVRGDLNLVGYAPPGGCLGKSA
jgi:hypothetical protein